MAWDVDYSKVFEVLPKLTGLPLRRKGRYWYGKCRLNGTPHLRDDKIILSRDASGGITILEQGGDSMQLFLWLQRYGGCNSKKEAYDRLKEMTDGVMYVPPTPPESPPKFIPSEVLEKALTDIGLIKDNLFLWLAGIYGKEAVIDAFRRYHITPTYLRQGSIGTKFWHVNEAGRGCHDKIILYKPDGHRDRDYGGGRHFKTDDGYRNRCCFGEHLLSARRNERVIVCESEKSAVIGYLEYGHIWLATGGANNLRQIRPYYELMPDHDEAGDVWREKYPRQCLDWLKAYPMFNPTKGSDIADAIMFCKNGN